MRDGVINVGKMCHLYDIGGAETSGFGKCCGLVSSRESGGQVARMIRAFKVL